MGGAVNQTLPPSGGARMHRSARRRDAGAAVVGFVRAVDLPATAAAAGRLSRRPSASPAEMSASVAAAAAAPAAPAVAYFRVTVEVGGFADRVAAGRGGPSPQCQRWGAQKDPSVGRSPLYLLTLATCYVPAGCADVFWWGPKSAPSAAPTRCCALVSCAVECIHGMRKRSAATPPAPPLLTSIHRPRDA